MVEVRYSNGLGNRLFQYCFGRILAEGLGYQLAADPIPPFAGTYEPVQGQVFDSPVWLCPKVVRGQQVLADRTPRRIVVEHYMQKYRYYRRQSARIREWLALAPSPTPADPDGLVVHLRLGDYRYVGWVLPMGYYHFAIARERFSRLYIVTDEPNAPHLQAFARYRPSIITGSEIACLKFIRSARRIVLSQSTFGWWGAFLSDAEKVYFPIPQTVTVWGRNSRVDLRVNEPRYVYVRNVRTLPKEPWPGGG